MNFEGFTHYKGLSSDTLQKVGLDILDNSECQKDSNKIFSSQICSGVKNKGGPEKDTCNGGLIFISRVCG